MRVEPAGPSPCVACLSVDTRYLGLTRESRYALFGCRSCGTQAFRDVSQDAGGEPTEYWESFKFEIYGDDAAREAFELRYGDMLTLAATRVEPLHSVLDVGCGIGNFVSYAMRRGLDAQGVDVSERAVAVARERGLNVYRSTDLQIHVADTSVDALTMWDVIEHLLNPYEVLVGAVAKVRVGGGVLFETPDGGFPVRTMLLAVNRWTRGRVDLTGPMYYWEHKVYFTERGLKALLERASLEVVSVRRMTSVREKMSCDFSLRAARGSKIGSALHVAWPLLESCFRVLGRGNKLMVFAVKR